MNTLSFQSYILSANSAHSIISNLFAARKPAVAQFNSDAAGEGSPKPTYASGVIVMELTGDSMAPALPNKSQVIAIPVAREEWAETKGLCAVSVKEGAYTVRRVSHSSYGGFILSTGNADDAPLHIHPSDVLSLYKITEIIYSPSAE